MFEIVNSLILGNCINFADIHIITYIYILKMSNKVCTSRLLKELRELQKKPVEGIRALPLESNILEWHYVLEGAKGTSYEGGWYHGVVTFPSEYPMKPPSITMVTPNGRFKTCTKLCLSMSDFHPENWNPMWSVGTILMGLLSFMVQDSPTYGSIETSDAYKRKAALESLEFNCKDKIFNKLFPELVELNVKIKQEYEEKYGSSLPNVNQEISANSKNDTSTQLLENGAASWTALFAVLVVLVTFTWALLAYAI